MARRLLSIDAMKTASKILFAIALAVCGTASTQATPIIGAPIFVQNTGHVMATFSGSDAMFNNLLLLASPPNSLGTIFEGHVTPVGNTVDLGVFAAGTELVFELNNQVGGIFFSGPASRNPDNVAHAAVDFAPGQTLVGFEDMFGGGDRDYNDLEFTLVNVTSSVPDGGSTAMLLGSGILLLAFFHRFAHR
jgi:VPDSG-CTERM motif/Domain of unknown function (DUF4114)